MREPMALAEPIASILDGCHFPAAVGIQNPLDGIPTVYRVLSAVRVAIRADDHCHGFISWIGTRGDT